jgi:hypothetical protein
MPISNSETVQTEVAKLIPFYSNSLFFKMHNVFKNRTTFSLLLWLYENEEGFNVEDVIAGFNLSRSSAFRYCRMLADAKVVERTWVVAEKDVRAYAKNRFVINDYGTKLIDALVFLEKNSQSTHMNDSESQTKFQKDWNLRNQISGKLESQISGRLEDYPHTRRFEDFIFTLMSKEYSDIKDRNVNVVWGRTEANAVIIWSQNKLDIIRCNVAVRDWPEPVLIGLLSHELSHIALGADLHSELQADKDVIARGLGLYLAIERVFTNKHTDHILGKGDDRYLGYESIRKLLTSGQVAQLDILMSDLGMSTPIKDN